MLNEGEDQSCEKYYFVYILQFHLRFTESSFTAAGEVLDAAVSAGSVDHPIEVNGTDSSLRCIVFKNIILGTYHEEINDMMEFVDENLKIALVKDECGVIKQILLPRNEIAKVDLSIDKMPYYVRFVVRPGVFSELNELIPEGLGTFAKNAKIPEENLFVVIFNDDLSSDDVLFLKDYFRDFEKPSDPWSLQIQTYLLNYKFSIKNEDNKDADINYVPEKKKQKKNPQHENSNVRETRNLRRRPLRTAPVKDYATDDEGEYEKDLKLAMTESLKKESSNGAEKSSANSAQPVDRFPEYNNEIKLLNYSDVIITMEDYKCLDYRELLLDVVLDFYLNYIHKELMPQELRDRVFVFNSQMYNNLAISTNFNGWKSDGNKDIPAAKKRYERVKSYHEGVNIFEKDYLVVPCYDHGHWFLAIICYPYLNGCFDSKGKRWPIEATSRDKFSKYEITDVPIKASLILVFDSVSTNPSRRTAAINHLRNFLVTEYEEKFKDQNNFAVEKHNIRGFSMKCPQQSNATDCGLFLLEFMEQFFIKSPLGELFPFPIDLSEWFDADEVFRKRHEISEVMRRKIETQNGEPIGLPNIIFFKEDDPDLLIPLAAVCESQINNNNGGNLEEVNGNNNNNDENGNFNNNDEGFNNNNDFNEANHNNVDVNMPSLSNTSAVDAMDVDHEQSDDTKTKPDAMKSIDEDHCQDQLMTDDEDEDVKNNDAMEDPISVVYYSEDQTAFAVQQPNNGGELDSECIILDDDDEDDKATHGGSSPDTDDEEMAEPEKFTNDKSDSRLNQIL